MGWSHKGDSCKSGLCSREVIMRCKILAALLVCPLVVGCQSFGQNVYDEQAEQECYEIMNTEAQRACLNELADERQRRN